MPRKRPGKSRPVKIRAISGKEVSVLAWIQDAFGNVLLVQQTAGKQLWSLPGGKVKAAEALEKALRRELREEIGLTVQSVESLDIFDRPEKSALAVLYRVALRQGRLRIQEKEILQAAFFAVLPPRATPSARYFWRRRFPVRGARAQA
jgi:ADP-ribose pyrophosphatase YjhB (NUDIX family)